MEAVGLCLDLDVDQPRPGVLGQGLPANDPLPHEARVEPTAPLGGPVVPDPARLAVEDGLVVRRALRIVLTFSGARNIVGFDPKEKLGLSMKYLLTCG